MARQHLTDARIKKIKPPSSGRAQYTHEGVRGLVLRVTARGAKSWSLLYRSPTKTNARGRAAQQRITLGEWPTMGVDEACQRAYEVRGLVKAGRDPLEEQRAAEQASQTFGNVAERFMKLIAVPNIAAWKNVRFALDTHMLPAWGARPVAEITRGDVHALLDELVARGKTGAAREVRKHASRIFGWAFDREIVPANPAYRLQREEMRRKRPVRLLTDRELRAVWIAAGGMGCPWAQAFRVLLLTGARRNEIARVRWSEVDREARVIRIDPARHKSRRGHLIPLAGPAWAELASCPRFLGRDPFVFSTTAGQRAITGFAKAKIRLDAAVAELLGHEVAPYRTHDLRVTFRSRLSRLRVPREWAEACLGHAQPELEQRYDGHDYVAEMREAMERYAAHVLQVVGGRDDEGEDAAASTEP